MGCLKIIVVSFFLMIGFGLVRAGYKNYKLDKSYRNIEVVTINDLANKPPGKEKWVKIEGVFATNENLIQGKDTLAVFNDRNSDFALFVKIKKDNNVAINTNNPITIKGLLSSFEKPDSLSNIDTLTKKTMLNFLVNENIKRANWFERWGMLVLGILIIMASLGSIADEQL